MRGVNKAIILGTLGKDVEVRYTPSGSAVASFSIATNEEWKDKQSGEKVKKTEWHNITAFGKLAEICGEYLQKGSQVYVEGRIQTDKYEDKQGVTKYSTKIIIRELQMLGGKSEAATKPKEEPKPEAAPSDGFDNDPGF